MPLMMVRSDTISGLGGRADTISGLGRSWLEARLTPRGKHFLGVRATARNIGRGAQRAFTPPAAVRVGVGNVARRVTSQVARVEHNATVNLHNATRALRKIAPGTAAYNLAYRAAQSAAERIKQARHISMKAKAAEAGDLPPEAADEAEQQAQEVQADADQAQGSEQEAVEEAQASAEEGGEGTEGLGQDEAEAIRQATTYGPGASGRGIPKWVLVGGVAALAAYMFMYRRQRAF